jgi:hypothetical protein
MACVEWSGYKNEHGYGKVMINRRCVRAHRHAWERAFGPIPVGLHVLHRCDNPSCVNPEHLFLGTQAQNMADKVAKGRQRKGERVPSAKLTAEQVREIMASAGADTQRAIAARFGIHQSTVSDIARRKRWGHLWQ